MSSLELFNTGKFDENCVKGNKYPITIRFEIGNGNVTYDNFFVTY